MNQSNKLGITPIPALLREQAIPAFFGILVMSIYGIVDAMFVGNYVGTNGIAAVTVVNPIVFLIAAIGMSIGIGGSSIISRAFGADDKEKAHHTFGNQITLTIGLALLIVFCCSFFQEPVLQLFGGKGNILQPAKEYFQIVLFGIPFLAWAMMSNTVIRAEGKPKMAMLVLLIPAITNMILDAVFIVGFDMGIKGAAWATSISYVFSASYSLFYFIFGKSEMKLRVKSLWLELKTVAEIFSIGIVTLARQGTISLLYIVLNNSLHSYGGELAIAVYGIINPVMMFTNSPVLGVTQGFLPIVGFNYGAKKMDRVKEVISAALKYGTGIAFLIFATILTFSEKIINLFTSEPEAIAMANPALIIVFLATPLITTQLVGSAYFQAIGKAIPALLLTLTKQGFFLIPLILILPRFFDLQGVWMSFPIADVCAAGLTFWYLKRETKKLGLEEKEEEAAAPNPSPVEK